MPFNRRLFLGCAASSSLSIAVRNALGACSERIPVPILPVSSAWSNWPQSEPFGPNTRYAPEDIRSLVSVVTNATSRTRVKASGSRYSASAAARADAAWIDTTSLRGVITCDLSRIADQFPAARRGDLVLVKAGTKIHELATALWARGKSIPTLGGTMGQSIAGAISTGTHGTDIDLPPIAAMVRAIHIVTPGGCEFWLDHPDRPVASRIALRDHYPDWHDSIATFRNAATFNAALVGVGRCGVIYSYVLEVQPAYKLRAVRGRSSWAAVRAHLQQAAAAPDWISFIRQNALPFNEDTRVASSDSPSVISTGADLAVMWTGTKKPGLFRWIHADPETGGWTRKRVVDDGRVRHSTHRPAIAFFDGRYYIAWTGTGTRDGNPYVHLLRSSPGGEIWTDHIRFDGTQGQPEAQSSEGPVLLAANGKLHLVWVGSNKPGQFRWITSTDGLRWGDKRTLGEPALKRESHYRPAIAFFNNRYYLAWSGSTSGNPYIHMISSGATTGSLWGNHVVFNGTPGRPQAMSGDGPCLLAANNRLHLAWVGTNRPGEFRWITSVNGIIWGNKRILNDGRVRRSTRSPELVFHAGRYHLFWTGYGSDQNIHVLRSTSAAATRWQHSRLSVPSGPRLEMGAIRSLDVALSPKSANGQAWWTVRTVVPNSQNDTRVRGGLSPYQQGLAMRVLAKALNPNSSTNVDSIIDTLMRLIGGEPGGAICGISDAIARRVLPNDDDLFTALTDVLFAMELNKPSTTGPSFEVTSGKGGYAGSYEQFYREWWDHFPKAHFTEVFFDARDDDYLRFIDRMLAYFETRPGRHAGYIAIRFMAGCEAPLAMQRWPVTVAVEVAVLQALDPAARQTIEGVNQLARGYNVRFHWGMSRPADYRPVAVQAEIEQWKAGARVLQVRANDEMSSQFSRASGLEP